MKRALVLLIALLAFGAHCGGPVQPDPDIPKDTHLCDDACANLQELGCPEGDPLPDGTTCTEFCVKTQNAGSALNPTCVAKIQSCGQMSSVCGR